MSTRLLQYVVLQLLCMGIVHVSKINGYTYVQDLVLQSDLDLRTGPTENQFPVAISAYRILCVKPPRRRNDI